MWCVPFSGAVGLFKRKKKQKKRNRSLPGVLCGRSWSVGGILASEALFIRERTREKCSHYYTHRVSSENRVACVRPYQLLHEVTELLHEVTRICNRLEHIADAPHAPPKAHRRASQSQETQNMSQSRSSRPRIVVRTYVTTQPVCV